MNLELTDPFTNSVPDRLEIILRRGGGVDEDSSCCAFNRRGTYLAVGYDSGDVVIWDFAARATCRLLRSHTSTVISVGWTRRSRSIMSASRDGHVLMWNLEQRPPTVSVRVCMGDIVIEAQLHPHFSIAVAVLDDGTCWLIDTITGTSRIAITQDVLLQHASTSRSGSPARVVTASFDIAGENLFLGTSTGRIIVLAADYESMQATNMQQTPPVRWAYSVEGCQHVYEIGFSRSRTSPWMVVFGGDRTIRLMLKDGTDGKTVRDFKDAVNQTRWDFIGLSCDAEHVIGGARQLVGQYQLYIWSVSSGQLEQQIRGKVSAAFNCVWHPNLPFLAIAAEEGVEICGCDQGANWTAFAADFVELETNVEFEEREDEFDIVVTPAPPFKDARPSGARLESNYIVRRDDGCIRQRIGQAGPSSIDVVTVSKVAAYASDSEDERDIFYLAACPGDKGDAYLQDVDIPLVHACCSKKDQMSTT